MEAEGFALPVIEAHCEYAQSARYDDEIEMRTTGTLLSPVRVQFDYEVVRLGGRRHAGRPATPSTPRSIAAAGRCRLPDRVRSTVVHEGTGHRRRRLHRIDAGRAAARRRRRRRRHRLLHRLLPAGDQGAQPDRGCWRIRASGSSKSRIQDADLPALLADRTHVFHLAAQAGVRKSWGRDFAVYTVNNIEATQVLLEACVGRAARAARLRVELVGLRRQRRDADARGRAAAAGLAVRRHQAGGRAALLPLLRRTTACRPCRCAISRCTAPGSGPTWAFTSSCGRPFTASRSRSSATASRRATSRSSPTRSARTSPPRRGAFPGACTILEAARACRSTRCSR